MQLELSDTQAQLLRQILDGVYRDDRAEIASTDLPRFKAGLKAERDEVRAMLDQLGGPLPNPA